MFFHMNPFAYGFGGVMMIFPMILWILLIVLIVKLFQDKNSSTSPKETNNKALDILKERFAKGREVMSNSPTEAKKEAISFYKSQIDGEVVGNVMQEERILW